MFRIVKGFRGCVERERCAPLIGFALDCVDDARDVNR